MVRKGQRQRDVRDPSHKILRARRDESVLGKAERRGHVGAHRVGVRRAGVGIEAGGKVQRECFSGVAFAEQIHHTRGSAHRLAQRTAGAGAEQTIHQQQRPRAGHGLTFHRGNGHFADDVCKLLASERAPGFGRECGTQFHLPAGAQKMPRQHAGIARIVTLAAEDDHRAGLRPELPDNFHEARAGLFHEHVLRRSGGDCVRFQRAHFCGGHERGHWKIHAAPSRAASLIARHHGTCSPNCPTPQPGANLRAK